MPILKAENITKIYGNKRSGMQVKALDRFSIDIEEGEFVGVMGLQVVEKPRYLIFWLQLIHQLLASY